MTLKRPAIFLDRDGVLIRTHVRNGRPEAIRSLADLELLPGVVQACVALREAGYALVVFTNQPDIARGNLDPQELRDMNRHLEKTLQLDAVQVCPHDDADDCACRKPKPGMILQAAEQLDLDLSRSVAVGDRWRDVEAGRAAGCKTVLLDCGYDEPSASADLNAQSLAGATSWILSSLEPQGREALPRSAP